MKKSVSVVLFVVFVFASTAAFAMTSEDQAAAAACAAAVAPEQSVRGAVVAVTATLGSAVGQVSEVRIAADSKATVSDVKWDAANPTQVTFNVDLSAAAAGSWSVDFVGADGTCHGTLNVAE